MRSHLTLWLLALTVVLLAILAYLARNPMETGYDDPELMVDLAINLLENDVSALEHETQSAIRAAAVFADHGEISSARGAYLLALQYKQEQNFQGAEALFKRAIALDPEWSWPYAGLGDLLGRHSYQRTEEAVEVLQKCIQLDPTWGRPHNILAVILRAAGLFEAARAEAELALKYMPDELSPLNNYANLLVDLERYDEAETYFLRAIEVYPEHPKPYYNLACLYSLRGRTTEALANLTEAFKRSDPLRREATEDPDLKNLKNNTAFQALVNRDHEHPELNALMSTPQ